MKVWKPKEPMMFVMFLVIALVMFTGLASAEAPRQLGQPRAAAAEAGNFTQIPRDHSPLFLTDVEPTMPLVNEKDLTRVEVICQKYDGETIASEKYPDGAVYGGDERFNTICNELRRYISQKQKEIRDRQVDFDMKTLYEIKRRMK